MPGRQFEQFDAALAPGASRGSTQRLGQHLIVEIEILIVIGSCGPAATGQIRGGPCRGRRIAPASPGFRKGAKSIRRFPRRSETIEIMQLGTEIIVEAVIVLADEETWRTTGQARI